MDKTSGAELRGGQVRPKQTTEWKCERAHTTGLDFSFEDVLSTIMSEQIFYVLLGYF